MAPRRGTPKKPRRQVPYSKLTRGFKGRNIGTHFQAAIYNLYRYFRAERLNGGPLKNVNKVSERVCDALHISYPVLTKVRRQAKSGEPFLTPGKNRKMKRRRRDVDGFTTAAIRRLIYGLNDKRCHMTVKSLLQEIREQGIDFHGGAETLRKVLHDLGFRYKKRDGVRFLIEQPRIKHLRFAFLRKFQQLYNQGSKRRVYLDETWVFRRGSDKTKTWQDKDIRSCPTRHCDSGGRYVVVHAGSEKGFVPGAAKLFPTKEKPLPDEDYHGDMDGTIMKRWFSEQLLPGLSEPSAIIMDNASYHTCQEQEDRPPTSNSKKADIVAWLKRQGISFDPKTTVKKLYEIVKLKKPSKNFVLEGLLKGTEHEILWLPPYHAFFNPIELIWGLLKRYYDAHIGRGQDYSKENMKKIFEEALATVTPAIWEKTCKLVEARILKAIDEELRHDHHDPNFRMVISLDPEDNSDSDCDDDDPDDPGVPPASNVQRRPPAFKSKVEELMGIGLHEIAPHPVPVTPTPDNFTPGRKRLFVDSIPSTEVQHIDLLSAESAQVEENLPETNSQLQFESVTDNPVDTISQLPQGAEFHTVDASFSIAWSLIPGRFVPQYELQLAVSSLQQNLPDDADQVLTQAIPTETSVANILDSELFREDEGSNPVQSTDKECYLEPQIRLSRILSKVEKLDDNTGVKLQSGDVMAAKHLKSLLPSQWMSPEVIDLYFHMLVEKYTKVNFSIHSFPVSFHSQLASDGLSNRHKYPEFNAFQYDILFIPIYYGVYWCLCVVRPKERLLKYYDSMKRKHQEFVEDISQYLESQFFELHGKQINWTGWTCVHETDFEENFCLTSCGVLICAYARRLCEGLDCSFSIKDINSFRGHILEEVVIGKLQDFVFPAPLVEANDFKWIKPEVPVILNDALAVFGAAKCGPAENLTLHYESPNLPQPTSDINLNDALAVFGAAKSEPAENLTLHYESPNLPQPSCIDKKSELNHQVHANATCDGETVVLISDEEHESEEVALYNEKSIVGSIEDILKLADTTLLVRSGGYSIRVYDLKSLSGTNWLNDEIINFYFAQLRDHCNGLGGSVQLADSHFYPKVCQCSDSKDYSIMRNWYRHGKLLTASTILVPVHLGIHWCLCVIKPEEKTIYYYDSMSGKNPEGLKAIRSFLLQYAQRHKLEYVPWTTVHASDILRQLPSDGHNCGVFICWYARCILAGTPCTYAGNEPSNVLMERMRKHIMKEMLHSRVTLALNSFESHLLLMRSPQTVLYSPPTHYHKRNDVGTGLMNKNNTCYINAVLQILFHNTRFVHWLLHDEHEKTCQKDTCFTCAVTTILRSTINDFLVVVDPLILVEKVSELSPLFVLGAQNDAHEFLRLLLSKLELEYLDRFSDLPQLDQKSKETTPVHNVFGGYMRTEVTCLNCGHISRTLEAFLDLSVDIYGHSNLQSCLQTYFDPHIISGYYCEKCCNEVDATKQYFIEKQPSTLCIQLKRFHHDGAKLRHLVYVKPILSVAPFMKGSQRRVYKLRSIITHIGSKSTGHYYAICQIDGSQFFKFNDSFVEKSSLGNCMSEEAYLIFFDIFQK